MYIEIDQHQFEIRISSKNSPIFIESQNDKIYLLHVPHHFKENELLPYLKVNAKKLIKSFEKNTQKNNQINIRIYEKEYGYKWSPNISNCYRAAPYIYSYLPANKVADYNKIVKEVLLSDIKHLLSEWEERLNCIIEHIYLKNFKTKSFKICHKSKVINYSIQLVERHFDYVTFIVAKSVFDYLDLNQPLQEKLMIEYVNDWRQCNRIYEYEREFNT